MLLVFQKVSPRELAIFVRIEFIEFAIEDIEVFVAEVVDDAIDVRLLVDMHAGCKQIAVSNLSQTQLPTS